MRERTQKFILSMVGVLVMSLIIGYFVFAWQEPTAPPPQQNVPAPINVGSQDQIKAGGLSVGAFISRYGTILAKDSGNVGIGTTNPNSKLTVAGPIESSGWFDNSNKKILLSSPAGWPGVTATDDAGHRGDIRRVSYGWDFAVHANTTIPPVIMTIHETGNVGIGTTNPGATLQVAASGPVRNTCGGNWLNNASAIRFQDNPGGGCGDDAYIAYYAVGPDKTVLEIAVKNDGPGPISDNIALMPSGNVGIGTTNPDYKLRVEGGVYAQSYSCPSDVRFKTEIQPLSGVLEKLENLTPVSFTWKENAPNAGKRDIGIIGQELQKYFPELVSIDQQGYLNVDYSKLSVILLEAIKEQQGIIKEQENKIKELEERILKIESLLGGKESKY